MKQWNSLIKYRLGTYLSSSKFIVPLIVYISLTYVTYQLIPTSFVSDLQVSATLVGFIMMWITYSFFESQDAVGESILFCNLNQNKRKYYASNLVALLLICLMLSAFGVVYPFALDAVKGGIMFKYPIGPAEFVGGLLLHIVVSLIFIAVAYMFQPRMIRDRKLAIILLLIAAVITISKNPMIEGCDALKYILWVFPSVSKIVGGCGEVDGFTLQGMLTAIMYGGIYSGVLLTIGVYVVKKKRF